MNRKTIASIVGARPQIIKAATVLRSLLDEYRGVLVHTGQHYDYGMSDIFFGELNIRPPDINLEIGSGPHGIQTGKMLIELEKVFGKINPDFVVVYGDTNSTLAGALASSKMNIPVAHVEAGLRSFNMTMPEEINRVLTDHISNLLFCPTDSAIDNLQKEGIKKGAHLVGDVMYDALLFNLPIARERSTILKKLELRRDSYALATIHRAKNTDNPARLRAILSALSSLPARVVFPLHPRTRKILRELEFSIGSNIEMIKPVGYFDMLALQENANCILTDSGGIQKEAYLLGVRCITLREETEWTETVQLGWNCLVGIDGNKILKSFETWFPRGERPAIFGDGHTAGQICEILSSYLA